MSQAVVEHHDYTGSKIGMWIFLFTELILFAGMFLLYAVFRNNYISDFHLASQSLYLTLGTLNTLILLTSSLTMVLAITAIQNKNKKLCLIFLASTILLGLIFMVVKYFEWTGKIQHGIYPNSKWLLAQNKGVIVFYGLYFTMTGLHGLHVLIGIGILFYLWLDIRKRTNVDYFEEFIFLENTGLYWHLVDIIWIFLFPLFYLVS